MTLRIAMWSGPRNISTALMRSFGSRADTYVCDEPLYAHYLRGTDLQHPMRDEILASQSDRAEVVTGELSGPVPGGCEVWYQKHMTHHLLPSVDRAWMRGEEFEHALLIREPRPMLASLLAKLGQAEPDDTGMPQQLALLEWLQKETGRVPAVVDSKHILQNPEGTLRLLCQRVGLEFDGAMLSWPAGPHPSDGVWAPHWYANTWASTQFGEYEAKDVELPAEYEGMASELDDIYSALSVHSLRA